MIHQQPMKQGCVPLELLLLHQELRAGGEDAIGAGVAFSLRRRWYCPMLVLLKRLWTLRTAGWPRKKGKQGGETPSKHTGGRHAAHSLPKVRRLAGDGATACLLSVAS